METKPITDVWRWESAATPVVVDLDLRVVDGLSAEAARGLGAVPRRGVEVGGVLLGVVGAGTPPTVFIRQFEPVAIEYLHGPQFRLSDKDRQNFRLAMARLRHQSPDLRPVGFYRSDTGEALALTAEDLELMSEFFPQPQAIVLLIHPAVLKAATAAILVRDENGSFPADAPSETFPFRRRELTGGASEPPQGAWNRHAHRADSEPAADPVPPAAAVAPISEVAEPLAAVFEPPEAPRSRVRVAFAVLLLALLALGATAGDWYARRQAPAVSASTLLAEDPYAVRLSAVQRENSVLVSWDRSARIIRSGERGRLTIAEGDQSKTVDLDATQLRYGSVLYRHVAPEIRFRLEIHPAENRILAETLIWHPAPAKAN